MSSIDQKLTPEEIRQRRINKKGLNLNILLVGENGIGKKTFVNTLCNKQVLEAEEQGHGADFKIETRTINIVEPKSIPIQLRVSYTVNFGLKLENSDNADLINSFIEKEYKTILEEEVRINRNPRKEDKRVHVAIYFVRPTGKGLNQFDLAVLKQISAKVNVVPVIAKSDTLTESEVKLNKKLISESIKHHKIDIFNFEDDEEDFQTLQEKVPFSIISSDLMEEGKHVRKYPWGKVVIEDSDCDLLLFKNILFGSHLQEFKDQTVHKKYESYRCEKLSGRSHGKEVY